MALVVALGCHGGLVPIVAAESDAVRVEQVLSGLKKPCGILIQPRSNSKEYGILITESAGGRVIGYMDTPLPPQLAAAFGAKMPVIMNGFEVPQSNTAPDKPSMIGPLCLLFLDANQVAAHRLVVGSNGDGQGKLRLYEIGGRALPVAADQSVQTVHFPDKVDATSAVYSMARTHANDIVPDMLVVSCVGADGIATLWKIPVKADTLGEAELFAQTGQGRSFAPAVTVSPHGFVVAVEVNQNHANMLTFFNPANGNVVMQLPLALRKVVALAYSPRTGNLYAADFPPGNDQRGGIYRLDDAGTSAQAQVAATRIADVERPTSLGFATDGTLYVTALGPSDEDKEESGVLLKLTGEL